MKIIHHPTDNKGYFAAVDGETEAGKMTYTMAGTDRMIIDHTEVEKEWAGKNVGKQILLELHAYARQQHLKVIPLCPFARSMFNKLPELRDVL